MTAEAYRELQNQRFLLQMILETEMGRSQWVLQLYRKTGEFEGGQEICNLQDVFLRWGLELEQHLGLLQDWLARNDVSEFFEVVRGHIPEMRKEYLALVAKEPDEDGV